MAAVKRGLRGRWSSRADLARRVDELELEVQECRQLNLRVAELVDAVSDLLVPLATGDRDEAAEAVARYRAAVSEPVKRA